MKTADAEIRKIMKGMMMTNRYRNAERHGRGFASLALLTATLTLGLHGLASAQVFVVEEGDEASQVPQSTARLKFEVMVHDLGDILDTEPQTVRFKFQNMGQEMATIEKVRTTCGCTVPQLQIMDYLPGEKGEIEVTFDPDHKKGPQDKIITVFSNDGTQPMIQLHVKCVVKQAVRFDPPNMFSIGEVVFDQASTNILTLTSTQPDFQLDSVTVMKNSLTATILDTETIEQEDGSMTYVARVEIKTDPLSQGPHNWELKFHCRMKDEEGNELKYVPKYPVSARSVGYIQPSPARIAFGTPQPGAPMKRQVRFLKRADVEFKILEARIETENELNLTVSEVVIEGTNGISVPQLVIEGTAPETPGSFKGKIIVMTDLPEQPVIELLFYGAVRGRISATGPRRPSNTRNIFDIGKEDSKKNTENFFGETEKKDDAKKGADKP